MFIIIQAVLSASHQSLLFFQEWIALLNSTCSNRLYHLISRNRQIIFPIDVAVKRENMYKLNNRCLKKLKVF